MKSKLTIALCIIVLCHEGRAQFPCVNGISTNPANPINNQLPSKRNTFFDWMQQNYQIQPVPGCFSATSTESPFFRIDNLEALRVSQDMLWEDGWELLRRGFGLTEQNTYTTDPEQHLYLVLYNRYTGFLRILLKVCNGPDYNAAKITLRFHNTTEMKTDLLDFSRVQASALDKAFSETNFASGAEFTNTNYKWFYADFPMMYDPCTCTYESKLQILSELIVTSQIEIQGSIAGDVYTKTVGGKAQIDEPGSISWQDVVNVGGKVRTLSSNLNDFEDKYKKFLATFPSTTQKTEKETAGTNLKNELKKVDFLKSGLSALPWIGPAISVLDVFIGGGRKSPGPQDVKLMPLTVSLTAKLNGTLTTTLPYHNIIFNNPGSKNAHLDPAAYPYYNEVLGVFNLIKTPEVWWERRIEKLNDWYNYPWLTSEDVTVDRFMLDTNTIKYVLNPAPGLTIQNMRMSIITEGTYTESLYNPYDAYDKRFMNPDFSYDGVDAVTNQPRFSTRLIDGRCFGMRTFKAMTPVNHYTPSSYNGFWTAWRPKGIIPNDTTAYLKIVLNLLTNNSTSTTQNVLWVATYPVNLKAGGYMQMWPYNTACGIAYTDDVLIIPATPQEINTFCTTLPYNDPIARFSPANREVPSTEEKETKSPNWVRIAPNPSKGQFTISINRQKNTLIQIQIVDGSGKVVMWSNEGNKSLEGGYVKPVSLNLTSGLYHVLVVTRSGTFGTKFLIAR